MQPLERMAPAAVVLTAFLVLLAIGLARLHAGPGAAVSHRRSAVRALVNQASARVAAAHRGYDRRRWDRVDGLAWALHRLRQDAEMQRTDGERAWVPLDADADGRELYGLIQRARWRARNPEEKQLSELLDGLSLGPCRSRLSE